MTFAVEQLVIFAALLGGGLALSLAFLVRTLYLALHTNGKERWDWSLAAAFALMVALLVGFQLWRVIIRF